MKYRILTLLISLISLNTPAQEVKVQVLNRVAGLIKVATNKKFVLLPVQESAPESEVRVVADNNTAFSRKVKLAFDKTDYYVPMDLSALKDKRVVLYVHVLADRNTVTPAEQCIWTKEVKTSDTFDTTNREKYRTAFHHTPLYGWMNDPNGQFYKDGVWHLYYQYNAYGSVWGNMSWAHSTSTDLIHWTHEPLAIDANGLGTIFSGSCVVDRDNTAGFGKDAVVAFFTSADCGRTEAQFQSMAYSTDNGKTFDIYQDNPVIASNDECRDPNLYWNEQTKEWNLYLVSALTHEIWFYTSKDLKNWEKVSAFGGHGSLDGVWECPDMMRLPVRGKKGESKWMLIVNINPGGPFGGSATQYFVGDWNGKSFSCDSQPEVTKWMAYGKDHYATVSWSNTPAGRNTVIAWMSNWQYATVVPTMQFRSANSLPRDLDLFVGDDKELYVGVKPAPEVDALRGKEIVDNIFTAGASATSHALPADGLCEIVLDAKTSSARNVELTLSNDKNEKVVMTYDTAKKTFAMDRRASGIVDFSTDFPAVTIAPFHQPKAMTKTASLRIFIDRSSIEVFEGEGRFAMTNLVFPTVPYTTVSVTADGKAKTNLTIYEINK